MVTAVTIWWGCWQWAHEANAPRIAVLVEEQAPSEVEASRTSYDDVESLTQVVTRVVERDGGASNANDGVQAVAIDALNAIADATSEQGGEQGAEVAAATAPGTARALDREKAATDAVDASADTRAWPTEQTLLTAGLAYSRTVTDLMLPGVIPDADKLLATAEVEPERNEPVFLGDFQLTYYWITAETPAPERTVQLYTDKCEPLAKVSEEFAERLALEGTGRLLDGRTLNVEGECDCGGFSTCFFQTRRSQRWGVGVETRPLVPFRSVAVDTYYIPAGTRMYIPELDGLRMPGRSPYGGFVHDGCVIADDTGGGVDDSQIDIFFGLKGHYQGFDRRHKIKSVRAYRDHEQCADPVDPDAPEESSAQRISV